MVDLVLSSMSHHHVYTIYTNYSIYRDDILSLLYIYMDIIFIVITILVVSSLAVKMAVFLVVRGSAGPM